MGGRMKKTKRKYRIAKGGERIMTCKGKGAKTIVFYRHAVKGERIYVYPWMMLINMLITGTHILTKRKGGML